MKTMMGAAMLAGATFAGAGAAHAEVTANISLTTDYVFRGVSLSDSGPAIQGGFDWASEQFYAGVWGSSVVEGMELDLYAGWTPTTGPVTWDFGVIGYFYPSASDDDGELDYFELKGAGSYGLTEQLSVGGAVYWSPENYGESGDALYYEVNAEFAVNDALAISGAFGNQTIEDLTAFGGVGEDDYSTWNVGVSHAMHGFQLDLRYHDTDIDAGSDIENYTFGPSSYDSSIVFTIGREL
ncbi:MAG: TorF family putative porin [Hyphomonadaceae bacterium]|nr:TorF family putative porin [Hyphomonadaceae bacterium]